MNNTIGNDKKMEDKKAIGTLVMNRIKFHEKYPKMYKGTVQDVIKEVTKRGGYEFNAYLGEKWCNAEESIFKSISDVREWNISVRAVEEVLVGNRRCEKIEDATVFHSSYDDKGHPMKDQISGLYWDYEAVNGGEPILGTYYFRIKPKEKKATPRKSKKKI